MTTPKHVYELIYTVTKLDNKHLGEDKASRIANIAAVNTTWQVYHKPKLIILFTSSLLDHLKRSN